MDTTAFLFGALLGWIVIALFGGWVASQKGRAGGEGFLLALLFGPFGVLIEALLPTIAPRLPHAPAPPAPPSAAAIAAQHLLVDQMRADEEARAAWKLQKGAIRLATQQRIAGEKLARKLDRDAAYRARGVEPGPFAWYQVLPELGQAAVMGLALAVPVVAVVVIVAWRWV
jgi:hypothetical protein